MVRPSISPSVDLPIRSPKLARLEHGAGSLKQFRSFFPAERNGGDYRTRTIDAGIQTSLEAAIAGKHDRSSADRNRGMRVTFNGDAAVIHPCGISRLAWTGARRRLVGESGGLRQERDVNGHMGLHVEKHSAEVCRLDPV